MRLVRLASRALDVRSDEWLIVAPAFATLVLLSAGHTVLETARDALLVTRLPQRTFALAYLGLALLALPATSLLARTTRGLRPLSVLAATNMAAAALAMAGALVPVTPSTVVATYVLVGVAGTMVFPQFWVAMGAALTVGQGRRLLAPVAAASVLGSTFGSWGAAWALGSASIRALFPLAAVLFAASAVAARLVPASEPVRASRPKTGLRAAFGAFRAEPLLLRIALVVALLTLTALATDYLFKATLVRAVPEPARGAFVAHTYAVINACALVFQMAVGAAAVRRFGVIGAMTVTPLLALGGAVASLALGGSLAPVLLLKGTDGVLRSSLHRLAIELAYLPVSAAGRERAKPLVDGALVRLAQGSGAAIFLVLGGVGLLSPGVIAILVGVFATGTLCASLAIRRPYLRQLETSVAAVRRVPHVAPEPIDVETAELIVEHLGSDDPRVVLAAMGVLERRGRHRLLPSLVLEHRDPRVLERAFAILAQTPRTDWCARATRALAHPAESVRIAAARALGLHGRLDAMHLLEDAAPSVRGYVAAHAAIGGEDGEPVLGARVRALMESGSVTARAGMLAAIADSPTSERAKNLLLAVASSDDPGDAGFAKRIGDAAMRQPDARLIEVLIPRLARRAGREAIRAALVAIGDRAAEALAAKLADPSVDPNLRAHLPQSLARFGTSWVADRLLACIESDADGRVRYKAICALGRVVAQHGIRVDRIRAERCARVQLETYLHRYGLRVALSAPPDDARARSSQDLLLGLLEDKMRQAVERAFRLLKAAHPREDMHRLHAAFVSNEPRAHAHASEFLDALLRRRDQRLLRETVRIVAEELPPLEKVRLAEIALGIATPTSRDEALRAALADADPKLAMIAALHARTVRRAPRPPLPLTGAAHA